MILVGGCIAYNIILLDRKSLRKFFKLMYIWFNGFLFYLQGNFVIEDKIDLSGISFIVVRNLSVMLQLVGYGSFEQLARACFCYQVEDSGIRKVHFFTACHAAVNVVCKLWYQFKEKYSLN